MDASVKVENVKAEVENAMSGSETYLDVNQVTNLAAHFQLMQQADGQVPWMIAPYHGVAQMIALSQGVSPSMLTQLALQQESDGSITFAESQVGDGSSYERQGDIKHGLVTSDAKVIDQSVVQQLMNASCTNLATLDTSSLSESSISTPKTKTTVGRPPKKPLTPYMIFSKQIWPQVKAANSHLSSVCEIGAIVGSMWRDMNLADKQVYNELFIKDKERYDRELREYLKITGMSASDLIKPRVKRTISGVKVNNTPNQSHGQTINQLTSQTFNGSSTPSSATATMSSEQLFAQMDFSSALTQNSDGSINLDANSLANLLALQQQHLLASQATKQEDIPSTLDNSDQMGAWILQQQQQQNADVFVNNLQQHLNAHSSLNLATQNAQQTISSLGTSEHLLKTENDQASISELEAEVLRARALLIETTSEVERLTADLQHACLIIQQLKELNESSMIIPKSENDGGNGSRQSRPPSAEEESQNYREAIKGGDGSRNGNSDANDE